MKIHIKDTSRFYDCFLNQYHAADDSLDPDCLWRRDNILTEDMFNCAHDVFAYEVDDALFHQFCAFWTNEVQKANTNRSYQGQCLSALSDADFQAGNIWVFTVEERR